MYYTFNTHAVWAIYKSEMARAFRNIMQNIISPVISTCLYFVVFGAASGLRLLKVDDVNYSTFIVPGLVMLTLVTQSITSASFGIYFPKFTGTIYEILSAPISPLEIVIGYVGAAASKSIMLCLIILFTSSFIVEITVSHPLIMILYLILISVTFAMLGFIIGICAQNFEQLQIIPLLVVTPLVFLGGSFYSIDTLPPFWRTMSLLNPVLYLTSGFRWSIMEISDVNPVSSVVVGFTLFSVCLTCIYLIFRTGFCLRR
ncbi:MAG: Inner membrane transport permease YadH [Hyphomicrobiaceae bacterium hypho_1]